MASSNKDDNPPATNASAPVMASSEKQRDTSPTLRREASASSTTSVLRKQPSITLKSTGNSPQTSRNTSPIRPNHRAETPNTATSRNGGLRSRKNSHDASPSRPSALNSTHHVPSAASIQRALSATSVPQLQPGPVTEAVSRLPRTARSVASAEGTPTTATFSPRMKSPPPSAAPTSRRDLIHQSRAPVPPPINVLASTPTPTSATFPEPIKTDSPGDKDSLRAASKAPSRGPSGPKSNLETVQENTPPSNTILSDAAASSFSSTNMQNKSSDDDRGPAVQPAKSEEILEKQTRVTESESDGNKSDGRKRRQNPPTMATLKPRTLPSKAAGPLSARARAAEGTRNMTVETETVSSIPQSQMNADRSGTRGEAGGSVRLRPSNETIRPRKDRKRVSRKTPSVHNGTASSKADIFEARVASAVDEANSSDSDETFVYESNPPEPQHRANRNHSRTPSATSMQSQADRRGLRYLDNHRVAGKRSMKFSNNPYNVLDSPPDGDTGTVRAHPRHVSRLGRTMGSNGSIFDHQDSPFTQASKLRSNMTTTTNRQGSRPTTPQTPRMTTPSMSGQRVRPWNRKDDLSQYDFEGEGADDERTPLVGTVRTPRNRPPRRMNSDGDYQHIYNIPQSSWMGRFGGCLLGFIVVCLVVVGVSSFLVMSNKTMYNVEVRKIQNVLASEQEIMLDLLVGAVNPNVLGITVTEMDINVFAKSKHLSDPTPPEEVARSPERTANTMRYGKRHIPDVGDLSVAGTPWQDPSGHWHDGSEEDKGELEGDTQTMLLGRIFHFDQPLYFEGSPVKRHTHFSIGEMRLAKPGNRTEAGGSARWERVLQFPFELILRGVLKYETPISNNAQSSAISGSIIVHPEEGVDASGKMRLEEVNEKERWVWIEPSDAEHHDLEEREHQLQD